MNITKEQKAIAAPLDTYRAKLDEIPDDLFTITPAGGGWSFAEVYSHILKATLGSSIALEKCANNKTPTDSGGLTFFGKLMMFTGQFPPIKVKVPKSVSDKLTVDKISKEDAKSLLVKCRKRIDTVAPLIETSLPNARVLHPRLGMLNAQQWFKFIRIHAFHHLKQLERIKKKF
jgi:DinB superfamily